MLKKILRKCWKQDQFISFPFLKPTLYNLAALGIFTRSYNHQHCDSQNFAIISSRNSVQQVNSWALSKLVTSEAEI